MRYDIEDWAAKFQPKQNRTTYGSSWGGCMYETYGADYIHITKQDGNKVWTWMDGEDGNTYVVAGKHLVNRIGYFVTKEPWVSDDDYALVD